MQEIIDFSNAKKIINKYGGADTKKQFWDIFIIDALIGNYDRHNGNWGILVNDENQEMKMAPIYDCGSCLCSQLTDEQMQEIIINMDKIKEEIENMPIISNIRKEFYKTLLQGRYEIILKESYNRLIQ